VLLLGGFLLYPFAYGIVLSLHDNHGSALTNFVGLDNFAHALFGDAVFQRSLVNTLLFTGFAVAIQTGVGVGLAVLITDAGRLRTFLRVVFFAPFVIAPVAVGVVWKSIYAPYIGVVPALGTVIGVDTAAVAPLADPNAALWAVMAAFLWRFTGFSMVVYLAGIEGLPHDYFEHALLEGATPLQRFRHVTWPLLWPQTFALVLLTTLATLRVFDIVWVMTSGGPAHASETVITDVYATAFRFLRVGYAQAMALVLLVVMLATGFVEYRLLRPRVTEVTE
jgi:raffinose/stachyose/melibiose transport system permease protein